MQKYNVHVDNQIHKIKVDSLFPTKFANTILLQLPRTCFAVLVIFHLLYVLPVQLGVVLIMRARECVAGIYIYTGAERIRRRQALRTAIRGIVTQYRPVLRSDNFAPKFLTDRIRESLKTSTAKQVLGNCERMVLANLIGNRLSTFIL